MRFALLLAALAAAPLSLRSFAQEPEVVAAPAPASIIETRAALPRLVEVMRAGLRQPKPSANIVSRKASASLFDGSYDWHSCIFAHWALLTHARRTGDDELAAWVLEPLTDEALAEERARIAEVNWGRSPTYPYGHAWLVNLLAEIERHRDVSPETRAFRLEAETAVIEHLESAKFPENDDPNRLGGRAVVGWYRSWGFLWWQVRRSGPIGEGALERLTKMREETFDPHLDAVLEPADPLRFEFLWVPTIAYLVDDVAPFEDALPDYELDDRAVLPEEVSMRTTHLLGVHVTRLWPLAIAARDDADAAAALDAEIAQYLEREDLWNGDFAVVSHWVPQFLWVAFWLADGGDR